MWIYQDLFKLIVETLRLIERGESRESIFQTLLAYKDSKYSEVIELLESISNREALLNKSLNLISEGNYQIEGYLNSLNSDSNSLAISKVLSTLKEIESISRAVSIGDFSKYLTIKSESDNLAISINKMIDNYKDVVAQAKIIADGDYNSDIPPKSERDELGIALQKMTKHLRELKAFTDNQDWLKSNLNRLSEVLSGDKNQEEVAKNSINFSSRTLGAGKGAIYLRDKDTLYLKSTFAYTEREQLSNMFKFGEGIVGQVALEREPILLKNIKREDSIISTATVSEPPLNSYTYPLIYENILYGVIEISSFEQFSKTQQEFMLESSKVISSYLFASFQREEAKRLLKESKDANQKLQIQSEELMSVNAKLEEQQQQLQQQSEELQQSNAQLEELQQQLQQQVEEMQISNDELAKSKLELDKRNRELEEANSYRSQFLANVSHELRTPLNSIILLSKVLSMNEQNRLSKDDIKKAKIINESGSELLKLIDDILNLSKVESGSISIHVTKISTKDIVSDFEDMFEYQAKDKDIEFRVEDNYQDEVVTDRDKLYHILRNIVSNSIKFTKKGSVELSFERGDKDFPLYIVVKDSGIGIPKDKLNKIFEPFQQVDGSISREFGGTGLGLAITKDFASRLRVEIELESELGVGTTFKLKLPKEVVELKEQNEIEIEPMESGENLDNYILFLGESRDSFKQVSNLNSKSGFSTLYVDSLNKIYSYLKSENIPKALFVNIVDFKSKEAEILREIKSIKEFQNTPLFISDTLKVTKKYESFLLSLSSLKTILLVCRGKSKLLNKLKDNYVEVIQVNSKEELFDLKDKFDIVLIESEDENFIIEVVKGIDSKIVIYSTKSFSNQAENKFRKKSNLKSVIIDSPMAFERLLSELNIISKEEPKESLSSENIDLREQKGSLNLDRKTILVVDDDVTNIYVLSSVFEERGAKVIQAFDGEKAIEKLDEYKVDLILMDIMMPVMDGFEAIEKIRAKEEFKKLPIIAVTAKALKEDRDRCIEVGANDYISKPIDFNILVSLVEAWISKSYEDN